MIKLIVIDVDDTLCLTEEATFHLENKLAQEMGFSPMTRDAHRSNWGKPLGLAITERIPGIDSEEFMKRVAEATEHYVKEGILDAIPRENLKALEIIKKAGKRLAILTSRTYDELKHFLEKDHPINEHVEMIFHKDNSDFHKPDPRVFDAVLKCFDCKPEETVYLGDSPTDAIAAKGAGLHFIAVLESGLRTEKDFSDAKTDFFAKTFVEAIELANSL